MGVTYLEPGLVLRVGIPACPESGRQQVRGMSGLLPGGGELLGSWATFRSAVWELGWAEAMPQDR